MIQGIGVALALAGVLHVVLKGEWTTLGSVTLVPGDGWIVGATIAWSPYSLLLRKWPRTLTASARLSVIVVAGVLVRQRELGVARVGVVLYLGSIYAAVIAWLLLGEALHAYHAWAMAMAMELPGIYLVNRTSTS